MKKVFFVLAVIVLSFFSAYNYISAETALNSEATLAEVNGVKITEGDFEQEVASLPANYRSIVSTNKEKFLDDIILQELLAQEAAKEGLDKDKDVVKMLDKLRKKILAQKLLEAKIIEKTAVTEDEAKKYYEENKSQYTAPEQVNAAHILISVKDWNNEAEVKAAQEKAETLLKQIKGGEDFAEAAKENSDCPSRTKGGELGFFYKGQMVPEFEEAAFSLNKGELSGIVKTKFGYHIIKVIDKKPSKQKDFSEVKDEIEEQLLKEKQKEAFDKYSSEIKANAKITINQELLKKTPTAEKQ